MTVKLLKLRVKEGSGPHFKGGESFTPGEEFEGTASELAAFKDKLEEVPQPKIDDSKLKVSVPSGKGKRGRPKKRPDNESDGQSNSDMD